MYKQNLRTARSLVACLGLSALSLGFTTPSYASQQPASPALITMLAKAAAGGDVEILKTTLLLALDTEPSAAEALVRAAVRAMPGQENAILSAVVAAEPDLASQVVLPGQVTIAQRQDAIAAQEAAKPIPGFFDTSTWSGEATIGGSLISGNAEEQAVTAGLNLNRAEGAWEHGLTILGDYSRNNGVTTKESLDANYRTKWFAWDRGYIFGLLDFELDSFQAFDWRTSEAVGVGYRVLQNDAMTWDLEGGPGARQTKLAGDISNEFIFVLGSDFDYLIRDGLKFTNDTAAFIGSDRTTLTNLAAITAQLTERISGRLSFEAQHDTSVPLGQVRTETATRVSIVYGF